jgi:adenylate cyclase
VDETRSALRSLQHALRTPLGQIIGYGELLEEELRERGITDLLADVERIAIAAHRLLDVVGGPLFASEAAPTPTVAADIQGRTEVRSVLPNRSGHILVIDDEESNRSLLCRRLGRHGYSVSEASSGAVALRMIEAESFDLVLLDFVMPEMDGLAVLDAIRRSRSISELPVIMATARTGREDVLGSLERGANDFISKPFDVGVVVARIETQLALRTAAREIGSLLRQVEIRNAFLRKTFGRYLSDDVAANLLERDDGLEIAGERRRVTVMMTDVRGFTALTERIDPRNIIAILNEYLGAMTWVIDDHEGTVDEFIGDGILALFGAFGERADDAQRAISCAVAMQTALRSVNIRNRQRGMPEVAIGIGIATGDVVVGNIGSEKRSKFTAIGSAVNLAARLEGSAGGGEILISPQTYEEVHDLVDVERVRELELKGFGGVIEARSVSAIRREGTATSL